MRSYYLEIKNNLDYFFAIIGIIAGIGISTFFFFRVQEYTILGIFITIFCIIYFLLVKYDKVSESVDCILPKKFWTSQLLNIFYFVLFSCTILILNKTLYCRPIEFFLLIAVMSGVIGIDIITLQNEKKDKSYNILIKIIILSFILRWSLYYIYPGSYLGVDPWSNGVLFTSIAENGYLIPQDMRGYFFNPFEHILVVSLIQLTGLNSLNSMVFSLTIIEAASIIFIFLIGNKLFNRKVGLIAALILAINNVHIWWGWWPVAQTFGIVLFSMILWKIVTIHKQNNLTKKLILIFLFITIIFTHTLSSFVTLIVMGLYLGGSYVFSLIIDSKEKVVSTLLLLFSVFTLLILVHWIYYASDFTYFVRMFIGEQRVSIPSGSSASVIITTAPIFELFNKMCSLLFYGFSIAGIFAIMNKKIINKYRFSYAIAGILLLGFMFFNFFLPIPSEIFIGRWFIFIQIILSVPAGLGIFLLLNIISKNSVKIYSIFVLLFIFSFFMTTNTLASFDSPIYPNYLKNIVGLKESEIKATDTIFLFNTGDIKIDEVGARALIDNFAHIDQSNKSVKTINYYNILSDATVNNNLILFRNNVFRDTISNNNSAKDIWKYVMIKNGISGNLKTKFQKIYDSNSAFAQFIK